MRGVALELEILADSEAKEDSNKKGEITPKQLEAAARIAVQANVQELLRAHPRSLDSWLEICGEPPEHDADHGEADESDGGVRIALEVPGETTATTDPCEGALDDPALGQNFKAGSIRPLHDLQFPCSRARDDESHSLAPVAAIGEDALDKGKQPSWPPQQFEGAIAILDVGRMPDNVQQETQRVDEDVALAALDLLARVVA